MLILTHRLLLGRSAELNSWKYANEFSPLTVDIAAVVVDARRKVSNSHIHTRLVLLADLIGTCMMSKPRGSSVQSLSAELTAASVHVIAKTLKDGNTYNI